MFAEGGDLSEQLVVRRHAVARFAAPLETGSLLNSLYCSDKIAATSAIGSRTTGPVTSTMALVISPLNANGAS